MRQPIGTIPVRPHLEHIALITENKFEERILDLRNGTFIAYQLASLLKQKIELRKRKDVFLPECHMVFLKFRFNKTHITRGRIGFTNEQIIFYNNFLHLYMHELLRNQIDFHKKYTNQNQSDTIWQFMDEYKLHGLIEYDALKRTSLRIKDRKLESKESVNESGFFS